MLGARLAFRRSMRPPADAVRARPRRSRGAGRSAMYALLDYQDKAAAVVDKVIAGLWAPQEPVGAAGSGTRRHRPTRAAESSEQASGARGAATSSSASARRSRVRDERTPTVTCARKPADALQKLALVADRHWARSAIASRRSPTRSCGTRWVRACWNARESPELPRACWRSLAANDPVDYVAQRSGGPR